MGMPLPSRLVGLWQNTDWHLDTFGHPPCTGRGREAMYYLTDLFCTISETVTGHVTLRTSEPSDYSPKSDRP